jgi:SNF2 family DNA or RNA helicase
MRCGGRSYGNSIRRLKDDVLCLPEKEYLDIFVELSGKQLELYEKLCAELRIEITNIKGEIIIDESEAILKKMLRLTQIVSNPFLIDNSYKETPVKFNKLDELINKIILKNEKLVIWTSFIENIKLLKKRYIKYSPLEIYGETPIKERAEFIKKFQTIETNKIMLLNPSAAREGITLTSANNAIYLDRNFNLVDYLQS